jgi:hypothetical protein
MPIKLPSIPDAGDDLKSMSLVVRTMAQFLNQIAQNQQGITGHQYFELAKDSTSDTLRKEVALLRAEFEAYKKTHP